MNDIFVEWLKNEDEVCFKDRLLRLKLIHQKYDFHNIGFFHGGKDIYLLFEETRYCYIYGQFYAVVLLALSFIENSLANILYSNPENQFVKNANVHSIFSAALDQNFINKDLFDKLNNLRKIRNDISHFREPNKLKGIEAKSVLQNRNPIEILDSNAIIAIECMFELHSIISNIFI